MVRAKLMIEATALVVVLVLFPFVYCLTTYCLTSLVSGSWGPGGTRRQGASVLRETLLQYRVFAHGVVDSGRSEWGSDLAGPGELIVLVPGYSETYYIFRYLAGHLRQAGFRYHVYKYNTIFGDLRLESQRLRSRVEQICEDHHVTRLHFVGHSMGGILIRHLVEQGGLRRLGSVVTIASPHHGTAAAKVIPGAYGRQLRPGSSLLASLSAEPGYRLLNVWSAHDSLIAPRNSSCLNSRDLVVDSGLCHNSQLFSRQVAESVRDFISADQGGTSSRVGGM